MKANVKKIKKNKNMSTIAISTRRVQDEKGVVVLSLQEYERLLFEIQKANAPVEYVPPKEAARLDRVFKKALAEHKAGKTVKLSSLSSLMDLR
jgi:hypothetical protein